MALKRYVSESPDGTRTARLVTTRKGTFTHAIWLQHTGEWRLLTWVASERQRDVKLARYAIELPTHTLTAVPAYESAQ